MNTPCFECGKPAIHNHHVVPEVLGGTRTVPLCGTCHGHVHGRDFVNWKTLQKAGIKRAKEANGGKCPWGGRKVGTRVAVTPEKERAVRQMKNDGRPVAEIARVTGLSRPTVYSVLSAE